eukprot:m.26386 g.26386  ORF g.26386 m.26386 type:complete len:194 (-) comp7790_c0_seq3:33-614(-)
MSDELAGYVAGLVLECEDVPKKDKLKQLTVDIGKDESVTIVTNAPNVKQGYLCFLLRVSCYIFFYFLYRVRVVVATVGAQLKDGETVKKATVGGVPSEGMLCDSPMLGWVGGGAGAAALLPESYVPGSAPPTSRPRLDGKGEEGEDGSAPVAKPTGPGVDALFAKKLTKEEKKALAAKKKAERAAKKAAAEAE